VYIGLIDIEQNGNFVWVDGSPLNYVNWCAGYPSSIDANDDCVAINVTTNNCWHNHNCGTRYRSLCEQGPNATVMSTMSTSRPPTSTSSFIVTTMMANFTASTPPITIAPTNSVSNETCSNSSTTSQGCPDQWLRFGQSCYRNLEINATWSDAEQLCVRQDAHLTSIHSAEENLFVLGMMKYFYQWQGAPSPQANGWIGLQINRTWTDGTAMDYVNFGTFSPIDNCVLMYPCGTPPSITSGTWYGYTCNEKMRQAVCKKRANGII